MTLSGILIKVNLQGLFELCKMLVFIRLESLEYSLEYCNEIFTQFVVLFIQKNVPF